MSYELPPITDRQAVNVARNVLHTVIYARDIGGNVLERANRLAEPMGSDTRAAYDMLDRLLSVPGALDAAFDYLREHELVVERA